MPGTHACTSDDTCFHWQLPLRDVLEGPLLFFSEDNSFLVSSFSCCSFWNSGILSMSLVVVQAWGRDWEVDGLATFRWVWWLFSVSRFRALLLGAQMSAGPLPR